MKFKVKVGLKSDPSRCTTRFWICKNEEAMRERFASSDELVLLEVIERVS